MLLFCFITGVVYHIVSVVSLCCVASGSNGGCWIAIGGGVSLHERGQWCCCCFVMELGAIPSCCWLLNQFTNTHHNHPPLCRCFLSHYWLLLVLGKYTKYPWISLKHHLGIIIWTPQGITFNHTLIETLITSSHLCENQLKEIFFNFET